MTKPMSEGKILRTAVANGILPSSTIVHRTKGAHWESGELTYVMHLTGREDDRLIWYMFVGDTKLGPAMKGFGSLAIKVQSAHDLPLTWLEDRKLSPSTLDVLRASVTAGIAFVVDRKDLCSLLMSEADVRRGPTKASLPPNTHPARLVNSLILARDMGDAVMERQIAEILHSGKKVNWYQDDVAIIVAAKSWAKMYSKALGFPVDLS